MGTLSIGNNASQLAASSTFRLGSSPLATGRGAPALQLAQATPSTRLNPSISTRAADLRPLTPPSQLSTPRLAPQITMPRGTISLPPAPQAPSTTIKLPIVGNFDVGAAAARFALPRIEQQNTRGGLPIDQPGFQAPRTPTFAPVQLPSYTPPSTGFQLNPSFNFGGLLNRSQPVVQAQPNLDIKLNNSVGLNANTSASLGLDGRFSLGPINTGVNFGIGRPDSQGVRPTGSLGVQFNNPQSPGLNFSGGLNLPVFGNNGTLNLTGGAGSGGFNFGAGFRLDF
jgi:hypothetical protein